MRSEVVYIDTDPSCGPGAVDGEPAFICNEYIIFRDDDGNYYYALVTYTKKGAKIGELEKIKDNVDKFAWNHGLDSIEPTPLDKYIKDELKAIFK